MRVKRRSPGPVVQPEIRDLGRSPREDAVSPDAAIFGQLLAAQNLLFVLPDERRIAEFFRQAFMGIPGLASALLCLGDVAPQDAGTETCAGCAEVRRREAKDGSLPPEFACALAGRENVEVLPIGTDASLFGVLVCHVRDGAVFQAYLPFLRNLGNVVALTLENKRQRSALERSRAELEDRVRERTEELHNLTQGVQRLNQDLERRVAERTAQFEDANKELEAFAYSVSHDLRAPLRAIDGFSQLLLEQYHDRIDGGGKDYLCRVRAGAQRMGQLIDDLLMLSRVGSAEMTMRTVNLSALARRIANELQESAPERRVTFVIADNVVGRGDEHLLRIALENLLGNSWKYTSRHPTAHIEFGVVSEDGTPWYFIRDDGAGFDMRYVDKLFGAFQRLHSTAEFPGTGVGLATVQRIVRRHGGRVRAQGKVEKGTMLSFSLGSRVPEETVPPAREIGGLA